jgi:uncharacterized membrane-anchored protein
MRPRVLALCAMAAVQLAAPAWMIFDQEATLRHGAEYKFQTEPVDPYDCFRGRYVSLSFKAEHLKQKESPDFPQGSKAFAVLKVNADGFAEVERLSKEPTENSFAVKVRYAGAKGNDLKVDFPFDKFFMDEKLAPETEKAYREANRNKVEKPCWALVRVRHGKAALSGLFIDGQPIREYLRNHPK